MASLFELLGFVNWGDLEGYNARESGIFEYAASKIETIMMVRELNKRLKVRAALQLGADRATCALFLPQVRFGLCSGRM